MRDKKVIAILREELKDQRALIERLQDRLMSRSLTEYSFNQSYKVPEEEEEKPVTLPYYEDEANIGEIMEVLEGSSNAPK